MINEVSFSKKKIGIILFFILYPFGSLPIVFLEIYNRKKYAYTLLSIFMGFCGLLFPPFADLYRHNLDYFNFKNLNKIGIISRGDLDVVLYTISSTFSQLGINFEIVRFLFVFISYEIMFWIFRDILSKNKDLSSNTNICFISFIIAFLSVPFLWIVIGLRFSFASMLLICGMYYLFFLKQIKGWFFVILAFFTHFGVLPIVFLIGLSKIRFIRLRPKTTFILSLICFLFSEKIISFIFDHIYLGEAFETIKLVYIDNSKEIYSDSRSFMGQIANLIERLTLIPLLVFVFKNREKGDYTNFSFLFVIVIAITKPFMIVFDRMTLFAITILIVFFLYQYKAILCQKILLIAMFIGSFVVIGSYFYGYRDPLIKGRIYQVLYSPAPVIIFNSYDLKWINNNINDDGEFK